MTIEKSIDDKKKVAAVLLDLSKAFDNASHEKILDKCASIGIRGMGLNWLKSYLHERKFYIQIGDNKSENKSIGKGVPQGGLLSPMLFNIYLSDYERTIESRCIQYADDTTNLLEDDSELMLDEEIIRNYESSRKYFYENDLSLNQSKTEIIKFQKSERSSIRIMSSKTIISSKLKFLGLNINASLAENDHVSTYSTLGTQRQLIVLRIVSQSHGMS